MRCPIVSSPKKRESQSCHDASNFTLPCKITYSYGFHLRHNCPHQNGGHWPWGLEVFCPREEHGVQSCKCLCNIFQTPSSEWLTCAYWNFTLTPEPFHSSYSYHMYLNRLCVGTVYNNLGDITTRRCRGRRIGMVRDGGSFLPPTWLSRVSLLSGSRLPI
jgi:hypothetical protein